MDRTLQRLLEDEHFGQHKMAFVVGPRQVGKTTLARFLLAGRGCPALYRNWDDLQFRRDLARDPYGFIDRDLPAQTDGRPLVVLDEVHKYPRWKRYLKGLWDTRGDLFDILVTGSGRLDVFQRGGDSLLGRYLQYRLHPLSVSEILSPSGPKLEQTHDVVLGALSSLGEPPAHSVREVFDDLVTWGGFPEVLIAQSRRRQRLWHRQRRELLVRQDLRDMSRVQLLSHVEELVELLVLRAGSILSYNALRQDLQVAIDSVRLWVNYLQRLYFVYLIRPYAGKLARALRREPKVYLWDWSEIDEPGARFENMVASHLLKWCHFSQDWGLEPLDLHFLRDKEKREVDFLVTRNDKPWILVETTLRSIRPGKALSYFGQRLNVAHRFLVVASLERSHRSHDVTVIDGPSFLAALPV